MAKKTPFIYFFISIYLYMWKILKKLKCKVFACCGSKCSINDTDGDGVPDEVRGVVRGHSFHLTRPSTIADV
tara:strand:+ start:2125 stop:2340 length:216 start_codon:yes stop_codon:yes gene_type:complete